MPVPNNNIRPVLRLDTLVIAARFVGERIQLSIAAASGGKWDDVTPAHILELVFGKSNETRTVRSKGGRAGGQEGGRARGRAGGRAGGKEGGRREGGNDKRTTCRDHWLSQK